MKKGDKLPAKCAARQATSAPDEGSEIDAHWRLAEGRRGDEQPESVYEKTLIQDGGHTVTLLTYD